VSDSVDFRPVAPGHPDAAACLDHYFAELRRRFPEGFDPAGSAAPTLDDFAPPSGLFLVGYRGGRPVACGGFKALDADTAYVKRMWVSPSCRGLGLGAALLHALEAEAVRLTYKRTVLDTHRSLTEARALYSKHGYRPIDPLLDEPYADHWFAKGFG
jgi:GNAT superfamily N-acetyltransferase